MKIQFLNGGLANQAFQYKSIEQGAIGVKRLCFVKEFTGTVDIYCGFIGILLKGEAIS